MRHMVIKRVHQLGDYQRTTARKLHENHDKVCAGNHLCCNAQSIRGRKRLTELHYRRHASSKEA